MNELLNQFFNIGVMIKVLPLLLRGTLMTFEICIVVAPIGMVLGLMLAMVSRARARLLRYPAIIYVDIFRAIPPLVILIFVYSGLPFLGFRPVPFEAVCIAFVINNCAYYCEIFRAGLESVAPGQLEAARSTGLTHLQGMCYVVIPQAVRNVLPDLISNTIEVVKTSSLASVVTLAELLYDADAARSITYNASPIVLAGIIYLVFLWPCVRLLSRLQNRVIA